MSGEADKSMALPPALDVDPPLLNSANPWATDLVDLAALYASPHTGAVTTRTALLNGFHHDDGVHRLNSLGYSPFALRDYLGFIREITSAADTDPPEARAPNKKRKGFVVSVTGTPDDVAECYRQVAATQRDVAVPLAVEINLSCPNIPGKPPPAYDGAALAAYLAAVQAAADEGSRPRVPFGLKTPPYTHAGEFGALAGALLGTAGGGGPCPVSFLTATNTLGSCLVLAGDDAAAPELPGAGLGGLAGAPLHPLALGNVAELRRMLATHPRALGHIRIIGVGGVLDAAGCRRMRAAGAYAVGVGTALGLRGVAVFEDIARGL